MIIIIISCSILNLKAKAVQSRKITDNTLQNNEAVKTTKKNFKTAKTVSIVVRLSFACCKF